MGKGKRLKNKRKLEASQSSRIPVNVATFETPKVVADWKKRKAKIEKRRKTRNARNK